MLKLTAIPSSPSDLPFLAELRGLVEVQIMHRALARFGACDTATCVGMAAQARSRGLKTVLVWDILADDAALDQGAALAASLTEGPFDALRVQDPGIAVWVKEKIPHVPLQLSLEAGNHNVAGIEAWVQRLGPERVALSNELPLDLVTTISRVTGIPVEIQALGRLQVFYSPRKLVSPLENDGTEEEFERARFITSIRERKSFPILENRHGTFMFYEKDLFLLPHLPEIEAAGVAFARFDLRYQAVSGLLPALRDYLADPNSENLACVKTHLAPKLTRGFFKSNRTDKQFKKLKNPYLTPKKGRPLLGTVLETGKRAYIAVKSEAPLRVGQAVTFIIPEGDAVPMTIRWIRNARGEKVETAAEPGLWMVNHVPRISAGARMYG